MEEDLQTEETAGTQDENTPESSIEGLFEAIDPDNDISDENDQEDPSEALIDDLPEEFQGQVHIGITKALLDDYGVDIEDLFRYLQTEEGLAKVTQIAEDSVAGTDFQVEKNRIGSPEILPTVQDEGVVISVLYTARRDYREGKDEPIEPSFPGDNEEDDTTEEDTVNIK